MTTSKHIPDNSIVIIIKFDNINDRNNFMDSFEFEYLINKANIFAIKKNGEYVFFKHP